MLKNYLKIALRNVNRHRGYAFINIFGLAVGLACCLLILLFVQDELSFDRFHEKADRIYRVEMDIPAAQGTQRWDRALLPLGPLMQDAFPEIERVVRLSHRDKRLIQVDDTRFYEDAFVFAEPSFFEVFDFELLQGNPSDLARPYTVILTETMAAKYFGPDDPVGRTLEVASRWEQQAEAYEVVGVMADIPHNSHVQARFLASFATLEAKAGDRLWRHIAATYLVLKPDHRPAELMAKFAPFEKTHIHTRFTEGTALALMPLPRIHLYAQSSDDNALQGDIRYVYLFSAIALLILLIACINYMNLATARAARRAKEVGVRKVVGAHRLQLIYQFIGDSVLFTLIALVLALAFAQLLLPLFSDLMNRPLSLDLRAGWMLAMLAAIGLVVGVVAGSYPAFLLSRFRPVQVLKGHVRTTAWPALRKGLVVFQFIVTVALIACTLIIQRQMDYVQNTRLGFEKEQVVVIATQNRLDTEAAAFKQVLEQNTAIRHVTLASHIPGYDRAFTYIAPDGIEDYEGDPATDVPFDHLWVDHDYVSTLNMEVVAGRNFSEAFPSDAAETILINETTARALGWQDPIGKTITFPQRETKRVIGVLRDFHSESMKHSIRRMVVELKPDPTYVAVKLSPTDLPTVLAFLETTWDRFVPSLPFEYSFLDEHFEAMYRAEQRLGMLFGVFAALAVFVACLGLFGLVAFIAEQRTKEIGVRKVCGATVSSIVVLLSKDIARLVLVAVVVAAPLAYFAMGKWLEEFAYKIDLTPAVFLWAAALAFVIALLTVSYQAIKAALADPVEALRYE